MLINLEGWGMVLKQVIIRNRPKVFFIRYFGENKNLYFLEEIFFFYSKHLHKFVSIIDLFGDF